MSEGTELVGSPLTREPRFFSLVLIVLWVRALGVPQNEARGSVGSRAWSGAGTETGLREETRCSVTFRDDGPFVFHPCALEFPVAIHHRFAIVVSW